MIKNKEHIVKLSLITCMCLQVMRLKILTPYKLHCKINNEEYAFHKFCK